MKLRKTEIAVLMAALLALVFTVGYFMGRGSVEGTVIIDTGNGSGIVQPETAAPVQTNTGSQPTAAQPTAVQQAEVPGSVGKVNINTATAEELEALPGIGEVLAGRIITYRDENGPFSSASDIMEVKGIGSGIYAKIAELITVD